MQYEMGGTPFSVPAVALAGENSGPPLYSRMIVGLADDDDDNAT